MRNVKLCRICLKPMERASNTDDPAWIRRRTCRDPLCAKAAFHASRRPKYEYLPMAGEPIHCTVIDVTPDLQVVIRTLTGVFQSPPERIRVTFPNVVDKSKRL